MPDYTIPAEDIFLEDALNQRVVYWHWTELNNEGRPVLLDPIEIVCHYERSTETFINRMTNTEQSSRSKALVDRDLKELGVIWIDPETFGMDLPEGAALAALTSETDAFSNEGAYEIQRFDKIPNYDGDEVVRVAYM